MPLTLLGRGILTVPAGAVIGPPPDNAYVAEDGTTYYVAEDGVTYYVPEAFTHTVFSTGFTAAESGWAGFTFRQVILPADLLYLQQPGIGSTQLTFVFDAASTGSIIAAYIGNLTATNQNYDGNQSQLLFGGNTGITISGATPIVTDQIDWTFNPGTAGLGITFAFGASGVATTQTQGGFHVGTRNFYQTGNHAGDTSYSGTGDSNAVVSSISLIQITV